MDEYSLKPRKFGLIAAALPGSQDSRTSPDGAAQPGEVLFSCSVCGGGSEHPILALMGYGWHNVHNLAVPGTTGNRFSEDLIRGVSREVRALSNSRRVQCDVADDGRWVGCTRRNCRMACACLGAGQLTKATSGISATSSSTGCAGEPHGPSRCRIVDRETPPLSPERRPGTEDRLRIPAHPVHETDHPAPPDVGAA